MKPMTDKEFVRSPGKCPFCGSVNVGWDDINVDGNSCNQEAYCRDCEKEWWEIYNLVGYVEKESGQ